MAAGDSHRLALAVYPIRSVEYHVVESVRIPPSAPCDYTAMPCHRYMPIPKTIRQESGSKLQLRDYRHFKEIFGLGSMLHRS